MDTAKRDDVVPEGDEGGAAGAVDEDDGARLPDVDTAERDDVVPEDAEGATGSAATALPIRTHTATLPPACRRRPTDVRLPLQLD